MSLPSFENQETQPLPGLTGQLPTLAELRRASGLSLLMLAQAADVRYCLLCWMEQGRIAVPREVAERVVRVLSLRLGYVYPMEAVHGLRVIASPANEEQRYAYWQGRETL